MLHTMVVSALHVSFILVQINVGYEFSVYTTTEVTGVVTLCVVVVNFPGGSPSPFTINVTTEDGTAGMS